jgi:hypothetical protein
MELGATGWFQSKYEYSYDGLEAADLIHNHLTDAARTFSDIAVDKIKAEVIKPIIELVSKLDE